MDVYLKGFLISEAMGGIFFVLFYFGSLLRQGKLMRFLKESYPGRFAGLQDGTQWNGDRIVTGIGQFLYVWNDKDFEIRELRKKKVGVRVFQMMALAILVLLFCNFYFFLNSNGTFFEIYSCLARFSGA